MDLTALFLVGALGIALCFEAINGFHDTANAVATVIYTRSLRPWMAVVWSGLMNFVGVLLGGIAVAYSIVHLLPVDLLVRIDTGAGMAMVIALLLGAILWNLGTWYVGIPASSSHALIGSILGVGLANSALAGNFGAGVNWYKAGEVGLSLLISPLVGFALAALVLIIFMRLVKDPKLHSPPWHDQPPVWWVRGILLLTCTGVSLAHGSNDGQKGVGLIMLILIGLVPATYALNPSQSPEQLQQMTAAPGAILGVLDGPELKNLNDPDLPEVKDLLAGLQAELKGKQSLQDLDAKERWSVRTRILRSEAGIKKLQPRLAEVLSEEKRQRMESARASLRGAIEYAPTWVLAAVALALGGGTMVGWKRIVVTVGEKIGKTHLTYSQGASAELVAMTTIGMADVLGLPVSTTHVLSSGVAGTMAANRSGLQMATVRNVLLAWVLTLPASMILAGGLFLLFRIFV